jgi:hypothetical protein
MMAEACRGWEDRGPLQLRFEPTHRVELPLCGGEMRGEGGAALRLGLEHLLRAALRRDNLLFLAGVLRAQRLHLLLALALRNGASHLAAGLVQRGLGV